MNKQSAGKVYADGAFKLSMCGVSPYKPQTSQLHMKTRRSFYFLRELWRDKIDTYYWRLIVYVGRYK